MEYDASGRLIRESLPEGLERIYVYDGRDDLVSVKDSGGREKIFAYNGLHNLILRSEKSAEGEWREEKFTWDIKGRLTAEEDGEGGETHRLYDGSGRLTALYSPKQWAAGNGKRTEYRYDFLDRLTEIIHSDDSHEKQFRDGEGNIIKKVHPNAYDKKTGDGEGTLYDYDGENRMLRTRHPDGGVERFFYGGAGNLIRHVLPEQYDRETDDGAGYTYAYDLAGRLIRELIPTGSGADDVSYRMTEYAYDVNGNRVRETRYGGSYTEDGTLKEAGGQDLTLAFTYDARDRLVRVEDGLGARVTYRYDVRGSRVSEEQVISDGENGNGCSVMRKIRYRHDKAGRLTEKREILDSGLDETGKEDTQTAVIRFAYDANGKKIVKMHKNAYTLVKKFECCEMTMLCIII